MPAGLQLTQADVNERCGRVARAVNVALEDVESLKFWLDQHTVGDLTTLYGISTEDGNLLKSAVADLDQLRTIYQGLATLGAAKDFRAFARRIFGFGFNL